MISYNLDDIHFNVDLKKYFIYILYIYTYIQNIFFSIYNMFHDNYLEFYDSHFDKDILKIVYIDNMNNYENVYSIYIDIIYFMKCLFNFKKNKKDTLYYIYWLLQRNYEGFVIIHYFNKEHKKIMINLDLLRKEYIDIIDISNILDSFISNEVKNNIMHVELDDNDITDKFVLYNNSYKLDNLKVSDFIYLLNIIYNLNYDETNQLKIIDNEINEKIYECNKYINL